MTTSSKPFLILFGSLVVAMLCAGVALAIAFHQAGMITVDVRADGPEGCNIRNLRVPALLVNGIVRALPDKALCDAGEETRKMHPALRRTCQILKRLPDFALVEIDGADERVRVAKRRNCLVVDVLSEDEEVHLTVPLGTLDAIAKRLESI
jgi:hypothetical protein